MVWGRVVDRQDQLRLLALQARGAGATGLDDYVPPSDELYDQLYTAHDTQVQDTGHDTGKQRAMKIMQFARDLGGEVG